MYAVEAVQTHAESDAELFRGMQEPMQSISVSLLILLRDAKRRFCDRVQAGLISDANCHLSWC